MKPRPPLGIRTYCVRNLRQILPAFVILAFSVLIVVAVVSALRGTREGAMVYIREFRRLSIAFPKAGPRVTEEFRREIESHEAVERAFEARNCVLRLRALIAHLPFLVRGLYREDMEYYLEKMGARVVRGRLPEAGTNEVAVHELLLRSNAWEVGSEFGMDVDDDDWMPGRFRIVGVLAGEVPCGVASQEYLRDRYSYGDRLWSRLMVFPKPGRAREMNAYLRSRDDVKAWDHARASREVSRSFERILLIVDAVCGLLVLVIAAVVGLLQNIFFSQRMDEFALLLAVGLPRRRVLRKALGETFAILALSWITGVVLGLALLWGFDRWVLRPVALTIPIVQALPLIGSLILPVVALLFCGWTVVSRLTRLDPVETIERRR